MVVINLVPVKAGGGLQNALSFLSLLSERSNEFDGRYIVVCTRNTLIESFCSQNNVTFKSVPGGRVGRIAYELFYGFFIFKKLNARLVFSLFGGAPLLSPGFYKISGFAYSNIIQDEIDFWGFLSPAKKRIKSCIDRLRLYLALQSNEIIVETTYLADRSRASVFKDKIVHVVEMSPSLRVLRQIEKGWGSKEEKSISDFKILYLAGPHPNKRIHLLAEVLSALHEIGLTFSLITTLPENSAYLAFIKLRFSNAGISKALTNIGPVEPDSVASILERVDAVINVALLESFSNNWVEAWAADKPLICTDAEWARSACGNAAIYINPEKPKVAADILAKNLADRISINALIEHGKQKLRALPTPDQKFQLYVDLIESALDKHGGRK